MPTSKKKNKLAVVAGTTATTARRTLLLPLLLLLLLPVLAAVLLQRYYVLLSAAEEEQPPPADFGSGTMFDAIAGRYDRINRALALGMDRGWRERMVQKVQESLPPLSSDDDSSPVRVLDVATGTADVALLLAAALPRAQIVGVDPSRNMLQVGRQKVTQRGLDNAIHLLVHDAQDDFAPAMMLRGGGSATNDDDSSSSSSSSGPQQSLFDAATMAFGIRNVPDRERALCQVHRVLRDGARFCLLEFSEPAPDAGLWGAAARGFIRHVVPLVGGILSGRPREYWHLQRSIQDFPSPQEFGQLLETLDCDDGAYRLEELAQLNFGSVQLYVTTAIRKQQPQQHPTMQQTEEDVQTE